VSTRTPKASTIAVLALFALSCFGIGLFLWKTFGGTVPLEPAGYRVHVLFGAEATQLTQNSEVRISGVKIGKVMSTRPKGRRIDALIELERPYAPLPADARAVVRFKTLLGESFVEMSPGDKDGPKVADGGQLPTRNVASTQTVDEVLSTFDRPTRRAFKRFLTDFATATKGRGESINSLLGNAAPAASDLHRLATVLDAEGPALSTLIRDSGRALNRIGDRAADVRTLVGAGDEVLGATAAQDRALTETVRLLPGFLGRLRHTMTGVDAATADAGPALRTLRPVAPLVRPALQGTVELIPQLRTAFRRIDPIVRDSRRTLPALTRLLRASRPVVDALHPAGRELVPVLQLLELYRRDVVGSLANGAASAEGTVAGKQAVRIGLTINNEDTLGQPSRQGSSRWNPYYAPGRAIDFWAGHEALDCRKTSNPTVPVGTPPPCVQAAPWTFQGATRQYPHLQRNPP
jgi:ABC-type transporter Mla subunit MlaD